MPKHFANRAIPADAAARYAARYEVDENGCWVTTLKGSGHGYATGTWREGGRSYSTGVHRIAWTHHRGPIPDGMTVDHTCWNRLCVNPEHLRLLTNRENAIRRAGNDFPLDECVQGHSLDNLKLMQWKGNAPHWTCAECLRLRNYRATIFRRLEKVYGYLTLTRKQQAMYDEFMPQYEQTTI